MGNTKRCTSPLDRINEDGILLLIISSLPLREAVRTSVLSRRWRYIWTHLPNLYFDIDNLFDVQALNLVQREKLQMEKVNPFIMIVNSVLQQHQGVARVEEFKVGYFLKKDHSHYLDAWVHFAVASNSKKLILNLQRNHAHGFYDILYNLRDHYIFPCHLLGSLPIEQLSLSCCSLKPPRDFNGLSDLKSLWLDRVDVTEEDVRHLLSNCFGLQRLMVEGCPQLMTLSISHTLNQLEDLTVYNTSSNTRSQLKKIELNARNLIKLVYRGNPVDFILTESSRLTNANISFQTCADFDLTKLSKDLPYLEYLCFDIKNTDININSQVALYLGINSERFLNLRHLEFLITGILGNQRAYLCLDSLLSVAPFMEKMTLNYCRCHSFSLDKMGVKDVILRRQYPHAHLKTVEIKVFTGDKCQIIHAAYLLNSSIALESMTLRCQGGSKNDRFPGKIIEVNMEYLRRQVPKNVKLLIL